MDLGLTGKVALVCPGTHATEHLGDLSAVPGPVGDPADFGKVVAFLCSDAARYTSGAALAVDGATSMGLL